MIWKTTRIYKIDGIFNYELEILMNKTMPFTINNSSLKYLIKMLELYE